MAVALAPNNRDPLAGHNITALKTEVYQACIPPWKDNHEVIFHQSDIFELEIIPNDNVHLLLAVLQRLCDEKLFKPVTVPGLGMGWKLRTKEEARNYLSLKKEEEMVYSLIDEAGADGIWSKTIRGKCNIHDAVFAKVIKVLETKNMITDMKSVEHPTRKMYLKSSLRPSERATGGAWFTDGELDEVFVENVMKVILTRIQGKTFYRSSSVLKTPKKIVKKMTPEEAKAARDAGLSSRTEVVDEKTKRKQVLDAFLPMPAGYQGYPSAPDITLWVDESNAFMQTLSEVDIQQVLDIMVYDGVIERVLGGGDAVMYKATRKSLMHPEEGGSKFTEVPCGRCPVFNLCEEGGPVAPSTCEYFTEWLEL